LQALVVLTLVYYNWLASHLKTLKEITEITKNLSFLAQAAGFFKK
jgi:hypothetical protein